MVKQLIGHLSLATFIILASSCGKGSRIFQTVDSVGKVPGQFRLFNTFSYDSATVFSVDGLDRERVPCNKLSAYYPTESGFNQDPLRPSSKSLNTFNPVVSTLYNAQVVAAFRPQTSYLVLSTFASYDTITRPKETVTPRLVYYPEDVYHPFDGSTSLRFFNLVAGQSASTLTLTPNLGSGTSVIIPEIDLSIPRNSLAPVQPVRASDSYITTQGGDKKISLTLNATGYSTTGNVRLRLNYLPITLESAKSYSFIATGDVKNYLAKLEPIPKVFMLEDGKSSSPIELQLSSVTYPGNNSTTAQITVVGGAYNIPGIERFGQAGFPGYTVYDGHIVNFNGLAARVQPWRITGCDCPLVVVESFFDPDASRLAQARFANITLQPGSFRISVRHAGSVTPIFASQSYNFEQGESYSVCLVPNNSVNNKCDILTLKNDRDPVPNLFKLRVINLMGGVPFIDVHVGSSDGPVIAGDVPFGKDYNYITLNQQPTGQKLYLTVAGSTQLLFQTGNKPGPLSLPFLGGNSGTLFLMGLNPGLPYAGTENTMTPYAYFVNEAFINSASKLGNLSLFY